MDLIILDLEPKPLVKLILLTKIQSVELNKGILNLWEFEFFILKVDSFVNFFLHFSNSLIN